MNPIAQEKKVSDSVIFFSPSLEKHIRTSEQSHASCLQGSMSAQPDRLTLLVRKDAHFATQNLCLKSAGTRPDIGQHVTMAYAEWGARVIKALVGSLDYSGRFNLRLEKHPPATIHYHSSDSLAVTVLRKAAQEVQCLRGSGPKPMYVSLDEQINEHVFKASRIKGDFAEVGFSRLFSIQGEQKGYVGRPGKGGLKEQIESVAARLMQRRKRGEGPVPIVLLEDNVRHAKMPLWVIDQMEEAGVFRYGQLSAVATCFSVATAQEREKLVHHNKKIPLIVGYDYTGGPVDCITTRDHLFDGFVVEHQGDCGRLPSFMMPTEKIAQSCKIVKAHVPVFMDNILTANILFCQTVRQKAGVSLKLEDFVPGSLMSKVLSIPPSSPMENVLCCLHRNLRKNQYKGILSSPSFH